MLSIGVEKLLETIGLLVERIGHDLTVRVLPTLYDGRTRYARQTLSAIRERFKALDIKTKYYSPEIHKGSFALPPYIAEKIA